MTGCLETVGPRPSLPPALSGRLTFPDLRQLSYFVAVAEHLNFTRAAESLYVGQPTVSAQLRRLERYLGVTLLVRTSRQVELTPAGRALLPQAQALLDEARRLADSVRNSDQEPCET